MKKQTNQKKHTLIPLLAVFAVIAVIIGLMVFFQARNTGGKETQSVAAGAESGTVQPWQPATVNAREYYQKNAQKVLAVTPAKSSEKVYSEKAVGKALSDRGFGGLPVDYMYDMDGKVLEKTQIAASSDAVHPQYTLTYQTKNGAYWTVYVCNDSISAYPVSYNLEHDGAGEVLITESASITAYDSKENLFFDVVPKPSVLVLKQIPTITADALERLTAQEIETL